MLTSSALDRIRRHRRGTGPASTDAELVAAILDGETTAWDSLLERYHAFIFALALKLGLSTPDAEDVFQSTCIKLYRHLNTLRDANRLAGWIAAVVRQEAQLLRRRRGVREAREVALDPSVELQDRVGVGPEEAVLEMERQHFVRLGMKELSDECRTLLDLLYGEEALSSYADVARELNLPIGSIGPTRGRCLERLRRILSRHGF